MLPLNRRLPSQARRRGRRQRARAKRRSDAQSEDFSPVVSGYHKGGGAGGLWPGAGDYGDPAVRLWHLGSDSGMPVIYQYVLCPTHCLKSVGLE